MTELTGSSAAPQVVIVGAGPTGVAAAILLGQSGVRTLVLERWPDVFPQPRAAHLDDEIHRILNSLGVGERFRQASRPGAGLRLLSNDHRPLAQFDRTIRQTSNGFPQANMFEQPVLESMLRARMSELGSVTFVRGVEVTAVRAEQADRPVVTYTDVETGQVASVATTYVLGCDGANSLVRRVVDASMKPLRFDEQRWIVVDIDTTRELGLWDGVHQVCDSDRAATYMRISGTRHRWEFQLHEDETAASYDTLEKLAPLLSPWTEDLDDFEVVRLAEYTFRAEVANRWRTGDVFLLGDAAHLTPPFVGQGMGAGLRDAANLTWKIAAVLRGELPSAALDSYEAERRPHARAMIRLAMTVGLAMTGGGSLGDRARRIVIPMLPHLPGLQGKVLDSATPPLRRSALNSRGRLRPTLAGSLCPNVELEPGRRYDEVVGARYSLIVRPSLPPSATALLGPDTAVISAADAPALDSWLGRHEAALVRPDRTVMTSGQAQQVLNSLRRLRPARDGVGGDHQSAH